MLLTKQSTMCFANVHYQRRDLWLSLKAATSKRLAFFLCKMLNEGGKLGFDL